MVVICPGFLTQPFGLSLSKPGRFGSFADLDGVPCWRAGAGMSPRRATHFSLLRQRKVSKRKATLQSATPAGQTCVGAFAGCAVELATRWRAALGQPRRVRSRSMRAKAPMPPRKRPAAGAARRGWAAEQPDSQTATRAIAALGPVCASRGACARAVWAERSDGPYGCPLAGSLQDAPRSAGFGGSGLASV